MPFGEYDDALARGIRRFDQDGGLFVALKIERRMGEDAGGVAELQCCVRTALNGVARRKDDVTVDLPGSRLDSDALVGIVDGNEFPSCMVWFESRQILCDVVSHVGDEGRRRRSWIGLFQECDNRSSVQ